jgi:hypothetical protein
MSVGTHADRRPPGQWRVHEAKDRHKIAVQLGPARREQGVPTSLGMSQNRSGRLGAELGLIPSFLPRNAWKWWHEVERAVRVVPGQQDHATRRRTREIGECDPHDL